MKIEIVYKRANMRGYKTVSFSDVEQAFSFIEINQPIEIHAIRTNWK